LVKLDIEDSITQDELADLLRDFRFSSFFNSVEWVRVLTSSFDNFSSFWITARRGGRLEGAMPVVRVNRKFFFYFRSLPFATYGTPLASSPALRARLIEEFMELSSGPGCMNSVAVIFDPSWKEWVPAGLPGVRAESRIIELKEDFDFYRTNSLSSTKRKVCRRNQRAGVKIRNLRSEGELYEFYRIYRDRSSGWGGVHPLPGSLFRNIFKLGDPGITFTGAFLEGRMLGCHIDFYRGNMAQAWISGVSSEGNEYGAASFLIFNSVREAYRKGMRYFNLGSSGGNEGLIFFKESLGGERYDYLIVNSEKWWWKWIRRI